MSSKKKPAKASKTKATASNAERTDSDFSLPNSQFSLPQPGLVPKLRFPEFRDAQCWSTSPLSDVAAFVNEKTPLAQVNVASYVSTENILPDYGGVDRAARLPTSGSVTQFRRNDTLVSNIRPYLKKVWVADKDGGASNDVIVIRAHKGLLPHYLGYLLKNDTFIDYVMKGAKGVKMPRGDIASLKQYRALLPTPAEQQKIASCLSSLDELIAAQARKLEALRTHKKALMQQLFPRDGETTPRIRFPEFERAAEWQEKTLGNEGELLSSLTGKAGADFDAGEARFVTYMNVFSNTFVDPSALRFVDVKQGEKQNAVARGDVFFTISSETPEDVGMSSVLLEDLENCYLNSFCSIFRFSEGKSPNPVFTGYLLRQPSVRTYFAKKAQGSTRFNLSRDAFRSLPIFVPTLAEQQKIASCLSSLSDLIAAHAQKLAALRTHKKALMQQLFPSQEEDARWATT